MINLFVSLVAISTGATPRPVPPIPRLQRSLAFQPDACVELCREYEADRQGNGFDLCDTSVASSCRVLPTTSNCDFLYWSVTNDGQPGIVYSINGTDLTEEERHSPVSCYEARQMIWPNDFVHTTGLSPL
jgi:hypothetical protein